MAITPPEADENVTPVYGIRWPKPSSKAYRLPLRFQRLAQDLESVLATIGMPPVVQAAYVIAGSQAARDAYWGVPGTAATRLALQQRGATTMRTDLGGTIEVYMAEYTATNTKGPAVAGWYGIAGGAVPNGAVNTLGDTGWLEVGAGATGIGTLGANAVRTAPGLWARKKNGVVYITGQISGALESGNVVCTLPADWRALPAGLVRILGGGVGNVARPSMTVSDTGAITITGPNNGSLVIALSSWPVGA